MNPLSALGSDRLQRLRTTMEPVDTGRLKRLGILAYFGVYAVIAIAHVAGGWRAFVAYTQSLPPAVRPPPAPPLHDFLGLPMSVAWSLVSLAAALAVVAALAVHRISRAHDDGPSSLSDMDASWRSRARRRAGAVRERLPDWPDRTSVSRRVRDGVERGELRDRLSTGTRRGDAVAGRLSDVVEATRERASSTAEGGADVEAADAVRGPTADSIPFDQWKTADEPSVSQARRLAVVTAWLDPPVDPMDLPRTAAPDRTPSFAAGDSRKSGGRYSVVDPALSDVGDVDPAPDDVGDDAEILDAGSAVERGDLVAGNGSGTGGAARADGRLPDPEAPWPTDGESAGVEAEAEPTTGDVDAGPDESAPWPDDWIPGDEL